MEISSEALLERLGLEGLPPSGVVHVGSQWLRLLSKVVSEAQAAVGYEPTRLQKTPWKFPMTPQERDVLSGLAVSVGVDRAVLLRAAFAETTRKGVFDGGNQPVGCTYSSAVLTDADVRLALSLYQGPRERLARATVVEALRWSPEAARRLAYLTPGAVRRRGHKPEEAIQTHADVRVPAEALAHLPLQPMTGSGRWSLRTRLGDAWDQAAREVQALGGDDPSLLLFTAGPGFVRFSLRPDEAVPGGWDPGRWERRVLGHLLSTAPPDRRAAWLSTP